MKLIVLGSAEARSGVGSGAVAAVVERHQIASWAQALVSS